MLDNELSLRLHNVKLLDAPLKMLIFRKYLVIVSSHWMSTDQSPERQEVSKRVVGVGV